MHLSPSFVFEVPLIWNVKWLFHGHVVDVKKYTYLALWPKSILTTWGVYFVNMKQNPSYFLLWIQYDSAWHESLYNKVTS